MCCPNERQIVPVDGVELQLNDGIWLRYQWIHDNDVRFDALPHCDSSTIQEFTTKSFDIERHRQLRVNTPRGSLLRSLCARCSSTSASVQKVVFVLASGYSSINSFQLSSRILPVFFLSSSSDIKLGPENAVLQSVHKWLFMSRFSARVNVKARLSKSAHRKTENPIC